MLKKLFFGSLAALALLPMNAKENYVAQDEATMQKLISICCNLKASVVFQDEKEKNLRQILNFGHTYAHALEKLTDYKVYTHGEAVSLGMEFIFKKAFNENKISKEMEETAKYAAKNGFDYYGTVMTISRYKNAQDINKIGEKLSTKYPNVKWLYADFKKNNGYEDSLILIKENKMYFQEYCGCKYSFEKYENKRKNLVK